MLFWCKIYRDRKLISSSRENIKKRLENYFIWENDLVLDNCMGSGSTGVASINTNRNFIGMELNEEFFKIGKQRIDERLKEKEIENN